MARQHHSHVTLDSPDIPPLIYLWLLRVLVPLGGHRSFINSFAGITNESLGRMLGLDKWIGLKLSDNDQKEIYLEISRLHYDAENMLFDATPPSLLVRNIARLAKLAGFTQTDCRVLELAVLVNRESLLNIATKLLGQELSTSKMCHILSVLLGLPEHNIRSSISSKGALARSGLIKISYGIEPNLCNKFDLLTDNFAEAISSIDADPLHLLRGMVAYCPSAQWSMGDFTQHATSHKALERILDYLRKFIDSGEKGANILIYGPSGIGKNQVARIIAKELQCGLLEVACRNDEGSTIDGGRRLRAFKAAQCLITQRNTIILFDDAEVVFRDQEAPQLCSIHSEPFYMMGVSRVLEENAVPVIWVANSQTGIPPAFIDCFTVRLKASPE